MVVLLVALSVASTLHPLAVALAGAALGATVVELSVGLWGPALAQQPTLRVGLIPGGYVLFAGAGEADGAYNKLAPWRRAVIPLAGPVGIWALAATLLGIDEAIIAAARAPGQLFLVENRLIAVHALNAAAAYLQEPPTQVFGTILAKVAAFNLLPLPGLPAGDALGVLLEPRGAQPGPVLNTARVSLRLVAGLGVLFLGACWVDAVLAWWSR